MFLTPISSKQAYEEAQKQAEEDMSLAQLTLDTASKHNAYTRANGCSPSTYSEWIKTPAQLLQDLRHHSGPLKTSIPSNHPGLLIMPALRLADVKIAEIHRQIEALNLELQGKSDKQALSTETETRTREIRKLNEQVGEIKAELGALTQRVSSAVENVERFGHRSKENEEASNQAILKELEQQKLENAQLHKQYQEQMTAMELRHQEQILELHSMIAKLTLRVGEGPENGTTIQKAPDLQFVSPESSDTDD